MYIIGSISVRSGLRMSIYSAYGMNQLPWKQIVRDLCQNGAPQMDDPRWEFTHEAPERESILALEAGRV